MAADGAHRRRHGSRCHIGSVVLRLQRDGQRYVDQTGAEVLVTKTGAGTLSGRPVLSRKEATPPPLATNWRRKGSPRWPRPISAFAFVVGPGIVRLNCRVTPVRWQSYSLDTALSWRVRRRSWRLADVDAARR